MSDAGAVARTATKVLNKYQEPSFADFMMQEYECTLSACDIDVRAIAPLISSATGGASAPSPRQFIDLSFLNELRPADLPELFLGDNNILVRENMKDIFRRFQLDLSNGVLPERKGSVLIGSPGVGKSVLFFLAALYRSQKLGHDVSSSNSSERGTCFRLHHAPRRWESEGIVH
jgi:hypothetical protein